MHSDLMKAYLPSKFLQVTLHQRGGSPARLDDLLVMLRHLDFVPVMGIDIIDIKDPGLLILPTRQHKYPFDNDEIPFILDFISQGNPLFHLSNHPPLTEQDTILGQEFGYHFLDIVLGTDTKRSFDVYPQSNSASIFDSLDANSHFAICNSSMVTFESNSFFTIADFSRSVISCGDRNAAFGIARPCGLGKGAIVALGDSGLLGEPTPNNPGPGLHAGNNIDLVRCIVSWLRNQTA